MAATSIAELTPDRAAINRANAQHSTGPRTDSGKERVRLNAVRHGIYSHHVVLPHEDRAVYEALGRVIAERFHAETAQQRALLQTIHDLQWRLDRMTSLEANLYPVTMREQLENIDANFGDLDPDTRRSLAQSEGYRVNARAFDQIHRQEARLRRLLDRVIKDLFDLAPQPTPGPLAVKPISTKPAPKPTPIGELAPPLGFVPTDSPATMPIFTGSLKEFKRKKWLRAQARLQQTLP